MKTTAIKPIFILNAPARVGKDTIANYFVDGASVLKTAFKDPMYEIFMATTGLNREEFHTLYETPGWKDTPQQITNGKTPRELMIHLSESYIKPFFGKDYYGKFIASSIAQSEELYQTEMPWIIPDGGFQEEVNALVEKFGERVHVIQLEREGHNDFNGDSRNYVKTNTDANNHRFDTSHGNGDVVNFIKEIINEAS